MNRDTKVALIALIIASVLSLYVSVEVTKSIFTAEERNFQFLFNLLTPIFILVNIALVYAMHKGKLFVLKIAFWLYVVQVIGFEIGEWGFSLLMGFNITLTWEIGDSLIVINMFAALMSVLLYRAIRSDRVS